MNEKHLCPRRGENPGPWAFVPEEDEWYERDGRLRCSYCGSIAPELFMEAVEAGTGLGPTDKDYKVYVDFPDPQHGEIVEIGSSSGPVYNSDGQLQVENPTEEELASGFYRRPLYGRAGPVKTDKFYFMHLSSSQKMRFVELLNQRRVTIGPPGYFYRLPFFIGRSQTQ